MVVNSTGFGVFCELDSEKVVVVVVVLVSILKCGLMHTWNGTTTIRSFQKFVENWQGVPESCSVMRLVEYPRTSPSSVDVSDRARRS